MTHFSERIPVVKLHISVQGCQASISSM